MIIRQEVDRAEHATLIEPTRDKLLLFLSKSQSNVERVI